ncbi:hypothetical protein HKCCE2091_18660 [Rhodobacterales bacterium HKCCE2091]|nr:hypothetical protein [Rhodobacterales bacterium HKCCE2091]
MILDHPSLAQHIVYRLWRLRRVLVLVPALVLAAALIAGTVGGTASAFHDPAVIARYIAAAAAITTVAVVLLPTAPFEILAAGLVAAAFTAAEPWIGPLMSEGAQVGPFEPMWLRVALGAVVALASWIALVSVVTAVSMSLPPSRRLMHYGLTVAGFEPSGLRKALDIPPGTRRGLIAVGLPDRDGFSTVTRHMRIHDPETLDLVDTAVSYQSRTVSKTWNSDVYETRSDQTGEALVRMEYAPARDGTRIDVYEDAGMLDPFSALHFWLGDCGRDALRERIDEALRLPCPAIVRLPQRSLLCTVARMIRRRGQSEVEAARP